MSMVSDLDSTIDRLWRLSDATDDDIIRKEIDNIACDLKGTLKIAKEIENKINGLYFSL